MDAQSTAGAGNRPGAGSGARRLADVNESQLLAEVFQVISREGATGAVSPSQNLWDVLVDTGDDAAVLAPTNLPISISTDILVENQHFRTDWSSPRDIGRRAVMQNLADIAAMGGIPRAIVTSVVLPPKLTVDWVLELTGGLASACAQHAVSMLGGDVTAGEHVVINVTVFGVQPGRISVLRSGAQPGDRVAFAGEIGFSAAGYALLQAGVGDDVGAVGRGAAGHGAMDVLAAANALTEPSGPIARALDNFRCPKPPVALGPQAAAAGASAMIDLSDGLLRDATRVAKASQVHIQLHNPNETFATELQELSQVAEYLPKATGDLGLQWLLTGGEDHGLLATFPPDANLPPGFRVIGTVGSQKPGDWVSVDSVSVDHDAGTRSSSLLANGLPASGWDHFNQIQKE